MAKETGWAEPDLVIGQPRIQKAAGFRYLYVEQKHVHEMEVGNYILSLFDKVGVSYEALYGKAEKPPMLVMFINVPGEEKMYDMQAGFSVAVGTPAAGEACVRDIPPTLVAGLLTWGNIDSVWKSYGPLMDFMNQNGHRPLNEGWREHYLYWEGPDSKNNVTLVQHVAEECE